MITLLAIKSAQILVAIDSQLLQWIWVAIIILAALIYVLRAVVRRFSKAGRNKPTCNCGCCNSSCAGCPTDELKQKKFASRFGKIEK
jgi:hypothetical protein